MFNRATPENYLKYKHALALHKLFWTTESSIEFVILNLNTVLTSRQTKFQLNKSNKRKVGLNALANRLHILNNRIPLLELNKALTHISCFVKKSL